MFKWKNLRQATAAFLSLFAFATYALAADSSSKPTPSLTYKAPAYADAAGTATTAATATHSSTSDSSTVADTATTAGFASDAGKLNSQVASFYQNISNMTSGTLASGRLSGTYNIGISGNAATATSATSATTAADASKVQGQTMLDASGNLLGARLDAGTYAINVSGNAATATSATTATNSTQLNGQVASFYQNASNLTSGSLNSSRLSGTYNIDISGNSATADAATTATTATTATNATKVQGQTMLDASGNLLSARLDAGTYAINVSGNAATATTATSATTATTATTATKAGGSSVSCATGYVVATNSSGAFVCVKDISGNSGSATYADTAGYASSAPSTSAGSTGSNSRGYWEYTSNGTLIQWGSKTVARDAYTTVMLPKACSVAGSAVISGGLGGDDGQQENSPFVNSVAADSFVVWSTRNESNTVFWQSSCVG